MNYIFGADPNLCSHLWALCFIAQSLFTKHPLHAKKCSKVCPHLKVFQIQSVFEQLDGNGAIDNSLDEDMPEKIVVGLNIPKRCVHLHFSLFRLIN